MNPRGNDTACVAGLGDVTENHRSARNALHIYWQHGTMTSTSPTALADLIRLLDLEPIKVNIFRGQSPAENRQRVFGGQVAGQALVAASRTINESGRHVHSLHAYFLRPGDPGVPILYEVDRIRDGKSFSTRRVVAIQHGKAIFNLQASFQNREEGLEHHIAMPSGVPQPESLPDFTTRMAPHKEKLGEWYDRPRPIDLRYIDGDPFLREKNHQSGRRVWLRATWRCLTPRCYRTVFRGRMVEFRCGCSTTNPRFQRPMRAVLPAVRSLLSEVTR